MRTAGFKAEPPFAPLSTSLPVHGINKKLLLATCFTHRGTRAIKSNKVSVWYLLCGKRCVSHITDANLMMIKISNNSIAYQVLIL